MTPDELRALDRRVALEVMGDAYDPAAGEGRSADGSRCWNADGGPRRYSADMGAAWRVVEKLTGEEYVKVRLSSSYWHGDYCTIAAPHESQRGPVVKRDGRAWGESMPLAICRAALAACREGRA